MGKIIDAINANGEIEGAFNAAKGIINDWGGKAVDAVKWVKENFGTIAPIVATAAGSFAIFKTASNVAPVIKSATKAIGNYRAAIALLREGEALLDVVQVAFTGNVSKGAQKVQNSNGQSKSSFWCLYGNKRRRSWSSGHSRRLVYRCWRLHLKTLC